MGSSVDSEIKETRNTMVKHKCLICGGSSFDELLHIKEFPLFFGAVAAERKGKVKKYPLILGVCKDCSLIQQTDLLDPKILDEVYTAKYYSCPSPSTNPIGRRVINEFYTFFNKVMPSAKKGKLLEIACFDGYLLSKLNDDGWDIYGCDPAGQTSFAVEKFGKDKIVNDFFSKKTYPAKSFDVVIFRHLLEHLYDLHSFLDDIFYVLKDDGCVFIEVPNVYSTFDFGGFGSFFHQHITHFSIETLQHLLSMHQLEIEEHQETSVLHLKIRKNLSGKAVVKKVSVDIAKRKKQFVDKYHQIENKVQGIFADPKNKKIALFGASAVSTTIINMLPQDKRNKTAFIFDNDVTKHGKYVEGVDVPITPAQNINGQDFDVIIIASYIFSDEIYPQLIKLGVDKNKIILIGS